MQHFFTVDKLAWYETHDHIIILSIIAAVIAIVATLTMTKTKKSIPLFFSSLVVVALSIATILFLALTSKGLNFDRISSNVQGLKSSTSNNVVFSSKKITGWNHNSAKPVLTVSDTSTTLIPANYKGKAVQRALDKTYSIIKSKKLTTKNTETKITHDVFGVTAYLKTNSYTTYKIIANYDHSIPNKPQSTKTYYVK